MTDDFIPYGRHSLDEDDLAAVADVMRGGMLTQGPKVEEFERLVAARVGARHAVACSTGTAALHLAMLAAGVGPGDEIVSPAITFVATANCGLYVGATPRFADVDYATVMMTPETLLPALSPRTKAVLPVHFAGLPADMASISRMVRERNPQAVIVEDASHALGARHADGTPVGSLRWSDMAILSFHPVKHIATGEGGMVLTDRDDLAERLRLFRSHGITRDPARLSRPDEGPWYYEMQELGYNFRLPDMNCALGISQLAKLDRFVARRREIASRYASLLAGLDLVELPQDSAKGPDTQLSSWHIFPLRIDFDRLGKSRKQVVAELSARGIGTQVHYYPVPLQPYYRRHFGYAEGAFPGADKHYARTLTIPLFPKMTDDQVMRVADALRDILRQGATR